MLTSSLTTITRYSLRSTYLRPTTLLTHTYRPKTYTYVPQRNFGGFFNRKNAEREETEEAPKKKKSFFNMAKESLLEGFLKGPDFNRMEKSIILREAMTYEKAAENFFSQCMYQKSLENYKIALKLLKDGLGENDPELAYYIGRVGDVYYEVKEWDHAFNSYTESLELLEENHGGDSEERARLYFRVGMCCLKGNKQGEAVQYIKQALKFYNKSKKSEMRDTVIISCNTLLAECYTKFGQYNKALKYMEKAIESLEKNDTSGGIDLPMAQHSLNYGLIVAYASRDFDKAMKYMRGHQTAQMKMNGEEGFSVGMSYLRIGEVYALQGRYSEAQQHYEKALKIVEKKAGSNDKRAGLCHKAIGQIYGIQGDYKKCVEHTKLALECFEEEDFELAECYRNMAFAYNGLLREDLTVENLKKSVEHREKLLEGFKEGDGELMILNGLLVGSLHKKGEYAEGVMYIESSLKEICKSISGK